MARSLLQSTFRALCTPREYLILQELREARIRVKYWRRQVEEISDDWWSNFEGGPGGSLKLSTIAALQPAYQERIQQARGWLKYNEQMYRQVLRTAVKANIPHWKIFLTR